MQGGLPWPRSNHTSSAIRDPSRNLQRLETGRPGQLGDPGASFARPRALSGARPDLLSLSSQRQPVGSVSSDLKNARTWTFQVGQSKFDPINDSIQFHVDTLHVSKKNTYVNIYIYT